MRLTVWNPCVATASLGDSVFRERERREKERDEWERQYGRQSHSPSPSKYGTSQRFLITNSHMVLILDLVSRLFVERAQCLGAQTEVEKVFHLQSIHLIYWHQFVL